MAVVKLLSALNAASAAAATQTSEEQGSERSAAAEVLMFVLDATSLVGTAPTLQVIVELVDSISGKFVSFGTFAAETAAGTFTYLLGLGVVATTEHLAARIRGAPVPPRWRVRVVGGGTITDADYTLSAHIIEH